MATLTIRMPDDKAERLKNLAAMRDISVNKMFEEWATMALAEFDVKARFLARKDRGSAARGRELIALMNAREAEMGHANEAGASYALHDSADGGFKHGEPPVKSSDHD